MVLQINYTNGLARVYPNVKSIILTEAFLIFKSKDGYSRFSVPRNSIVYYEIIPSIYEHVEKDDL